MSGVKQRYGAGSSAKDDNTITTEYDPLAVLDEPAAEAHPMDDAEQAAVISSLRAANDKSSYIYRALMLFMLSLVFVVYLTPFPAYIAGTHPENHLTLFWAAHDVTGTHEDLVYLPAGPVYAAFLLLQGLFLVAAIRETVDLMGLANLGPKGTAFPAQPHLFGTAPKWLVPSLQDLRWSASANSGQVNKRADGTVVQPKGLSTLPPRLVYLMVVALSSLPMPFMVFGAGNFTNAAWWALSSGALFIDVLVEWSIASSEKELKGLDSQRYSFKGA